MLLISFDVKLLILAKEIRLKHKAPVLSIVVLDSANQSIGQGSGIATIESASSNANASTSVVNHTEHVPQTPSTAFTSHKVLICSEEQFKVL